MKGQEAGGYVSIADRRGVQEFLQGIGDGGGRVISKSEAQGKLVPLPTCEVELIADLPSSWSGSAGLRGVEWGSSGSCRIGRSWTIKDRTI